MAFKKKEVSFNEESIFTSFSDTRTLAVGPNNNKKPRCVRKLWVNNWNILSAPSKLMKILPFIDSINITVEYRCYSCAQDLGVNRNKMVLTELNT